MSKTIETVAREQLSDVGFSKWKELKEKMDELMVERKNLNIRLLETTKLLNPIYKEMEKLWRHEQ